MMTDKERIDDAVSFALNHGLYDGAHHKMWVIDQMLRILTGDQYDTIIAEFVSGSEDDDCIEEWDIGIPP